MFTFWGGLKDPQADAWAFLAGTERRYFSTLPIGQMESTWTRLPTDMFQEPALGTRRFRKQGGLPRARRDEVIPHGHPDRARVMHQRTVAR